MATYYDSADIYIESASSLRDKIQRIDQVIDGLISNALKAASNDNIEEYSLNDGQTIIRTTYRGAEAVQKSINAFESIKQMYVNRLNGRSFRLVDSKSISGSRYGR